MDKLMGLSPKAAAYIERLTREHNGGFYAVPNGETYDSDGTVLPLHSYIGISAADKETVDWCDHMIAEFQRRKNLVIQNGGWEIFREYCQTTYENAGQHIIFLGLKHGEVKDSEHFTNRPIDSWSWTDEEIDEVIHDS